MEDTSKAAGVGSVLLAMPDADLLAYANAACASPEVAAAALESLPASEQFELFDRLALLDPSGALANRFQKASRRRPSLQELAAAPAPDPAPGVSYYLALDTLRPADAPALALALGSTAVAAYALRKRRAMLLVCASAAAVLLADVAIDAAAARFKKDEYESRHFLAKASVSAARKAASGFAVAGKLAKTSASRAAKRK